MLSRRVSELGLGPLPGAEQQEHVEIHADRRRTVVGPCGQDGLDDEQPARRRHRSSAGGQDALGVGVVPVVDDPRQHVGVGAAGDGGEEVGRHAVGAIADGRSVQVGSGGGDRRLAVGEDAVQVGVGTQDRGEKDAATAADVDKATQPAEVVGGDDVVRLLLGPGGHRALEGRLAVRVTGEVLEEALTVDMFEGGASFAHGVQQPGRGVVVHLAAGEGRARPRPQALADRREREPPVLLLGQHVVRDQPPEHTNQSVAVGAHRVGDLRPALGSVGQHVGDAELGRHVQELRRDEAVEQARQLPRRGDVDLLHDPIFPRHPAPTGTV